jgi:hypothetical protein
MIWTTIGFSVGIVTFFCIAVTETFVGKPLFENNRLYIAGAFAATGVAAWFVGRCLSGKMAEGESKESQTVSSSFLLCDLRYWSPMCVALGMIVVFIRPLQTHTHTEAARSRPLTQTVSLAQAQQQPAAATNAVKDPATETVVNVVKAAARTNMKPELPRKMEKLTLQ